MEDVKTREEGIKVQYEELGRLLPSGNSKDLP